MPPEQGRGGLSQAGAADTTAPMANHPYDEANENICFHMAIKMGLNVALSPVDNAKLLMQVRWVLKCWGAATRLGVIFG